MINESDLQELRKKLKSELARLRGHVEEAEDSGQWFGANLDRDDLAHNFAMLERRLALDDVERVKLTQIERAMARLAEGTYGMCAGCSENIPLERLKIIPYATFCVRCQQESGQT